MRLFQANAGFTCALMLCLLIAQHVSAAESQSPSQKDASQSHASDTAILTSRGHAKGHASRKIPIDVVWGSGKRTVYFDSAQPVPAEVPKNGVVILNGTQKETRIFGAAPPTSGPVRNLPPVVIGIENGGGRTPTGHPVVVGVISSRSASSRQPVVLDVASAGSNAEQVVIGVASSGSQTAGTVEPVALGVSPRPAKRPPYRPALLDRQ